MALNGTMVKIETVTVGSGGAASIAFSNIPQTYTDLKIVVSARGTDATALDTLSVRFNGATTNYSYRQLYGGAGSGSIVVGSANGATLLYGGVIPSTNATASTFSSQEIYVPNYTSNLNKSVSIDSASENNASTNWQLDLFAALWSNTAAITSVSVLTQSGQNFAQHTTATLYGISRTTAQIKATGGTIYDDASYVYHLFTSSGTFTPSQALTADVLVVAGGGGSGGVRGGGGGAGGLVYTAGSALTASTNYTVTIGAGGTAGSSTDGTASGGIGSNSVFGSTTANGGGLGGGGGTSGGQDAGGNGGSGGGGGGADSGTGAAGGTGSQGSNGGTGGGTTRTGGGGGGYTAAGIAGNTSGNGGDGTDAYSAFGLATLTGQDVSGVRWYAGGGGGGGGNAGVAGTAGKGGAGAGGYQAVGNAGTANTGGGAGGGARNESTGALFAGAAGGSGVVIVRYSK
jgi:hypothetical protein